MNNNQTKSQKYLNEINKGTEEHKMIISQDIQWSIHNHNRVNMSSDEELDKNDKPLADEYKVSIWGKKVDKISIIDG